MAQTQVILLERVERLGNMGETVTVKPGYARNYLLPQKKALRLTKENSVYFEAQRKNLEADSEKNKKEAEKLAKKLEGLKVPMIRQASEAGQLYGSVTSRDIAEGVTEESKEQIERHMVQMNQNFKLIGLFPVDITLHPEVKVAVTINIARTVEESEIQAKTGKALIADAGAQEQEEEKQTAPADVAAPDEAQLEGVLEDGALDAEKEKQATAEVDAKEKAEAAAAKAEAKAVEEAAKAEAAAEAAAEEGESAEDAQPEAKETDAKEEDKE